MNAKHLNSLRMQRTLGRFCSLYARPRLTTRQPTPPRILASRLINTDAEHINNPANLITAQLGSLNLPPTHNEPFKHYAKGSPEVKKVKEALQDMKANLPYDIPCVVNGEEVRSGRLVDQICPYDKNVVVARYHEADAALTQRAIDSALAARHEWESLPLADRCAIFLKAADLITAKYGYDLLAATMIGQGKTIWQAEIEAWCELADFFRFNAYYVDQIYQDQPLRHIPGNWNRVEYRGLEGFVLGVSPFNFTAIGGNIPAAPAIMGNTVVWKPAPAAMLSNYIVYQLLLEAGMPKGVIQFVPGPPEDVVQPSIRHRNFAGLHFTGSSAVFKTLWKDISDNLEAYAAFPRVVGETGGKNAHVIHSSADVRSVIHQTIRAAFEFQGQKCSACSRAYVPESLWPQIKQGLIDELAGMRVGSPEDFGTFMTAVITQQAFERIRNTIEQAKRDSDVQVIAGGVCDDSKGWFVQPTILETKNPKSETMVNEIFGPVLTVYVYPDQDYESMLALASETSPYGLTLGIFAKSRFAINAALNIMRHAAGNVYINDKCTGAIVGQQPFGGARLSGTNDKAGFHLNLLRWASPRAVKENFLPVTDYRYPSNES